MERTLEMILIVTAKCSDMCCIDGPDIDHRGYVPEGLGIGGGDYIRFQFDTATGKIIGFPANLNDGVVHELLAK